ncbi:hypothetical protein INR49_021520, partial [Caranx melampygus]
MLRRSLELVKVIEKSSWIWTTGFSAAAADEDVGRGDDPIYIHCNTRSNQPHTQLGNYFRDGRTKIDFVLVWEVRSRRKRRGKGKSEAPCEEEGAVPPEESSRSERRKAQLAQWRDKFIQNLTSVGLLMEKEETANEKKTIHFLKLSVPWDVMVYYAEELCLRAPLQVYEILARTVYGKRGLKLGPFQLPKFEIRPDELNQRQVLYQYWARWWRWYSTNHLTTSGSTLERRLRSTLPGWFLHSLAAAGSCGWNPGLC